MEIDTNALDLAAFIGKTVIVKTGMGSNTCTLDGVNAFGAILTAETFKSRLIPWAAIDYLDLVVGAQAKTRVA